MMMLTTKKLFVCLMFMVQIHLVKSGLLYSRDRSFQENVTSMDYMDTIINTKPANTSHSYHLITQLPLKSFEFKYDSIIGRKQIGLVGPEIKEILPESVQTIQERFVFDQKEKQKISLQNFHVIDKDHLFMHNLAATQVLIEKDQSQTTPQLKKLLEQNLFHEKKLEQLQKYLEQEASIQLIEKRKIEEEQVKKIDKQIELTKIETEEHVKRLSLQTEEQIRLEKEKDQLTQKRLQVEDLQRREQNRDLVALQEESQIRLELKRRETEEVLKEKQLQAEKEKALLERNTTLEKAWIDVEGRIKQQRMNQDIEKEQLQQRLEAETQKVLQALQSTFDNLGQGVMTLLADQEKLTKFIGAFVALAAGIYLSREVIRVVGKLIEQRLGKPSLVRETSRSSGIVGFFLALFHRGPKEQENELKDVILREALETRVHEIAKSTRNAIIHGAPYRHLLLYGPPGTGKTMVAKRLARCSGMDYAILSGGDVGPLGSDAVTELHALFHWANSSPKGVLIFIDEAEAFLGCRATRKTHMSEAMRNALNALLYHTGTQSKKFMLVIATNRPEDLDAAVTDRIDDTLHFDLPEEKERIRLLEMYYDQFVGQLQDAIKFQKKMHKFGTLTDGMSGREIAKMMLYLQSIVYAQDEVVVTQKIIDRVIQEKIQEHQRKMELKNYKDRE